MAPTLASPAAPSRSSRADDWERVASRLALPVLALALIAAAALLMYATRGFTYYYDEWSLVVNRSEFTESALLGPHNEHIVLTPVLVFQMLWELEGLDGYWAFRVVTILLHLTGVVLLYLLARRRVGPLLALAPALALLFLGTAWEILLWPFEIQFLIPVAAGLGALLLLERGTLRGDLGASALLLVAFSSGSLGVPIAAGIAVELLLGPDRVKRLLRVVAVPSALYGLWLLEYGVDRKAWGRAHRIPEFAADQLGSGVAGLAGFASRPAHLVCIALGVLLVVLIVRDLLREDSGRARLAGLATMPLVYWGALEIYRPWAAHQQTSRYLYPSAVFVLLLAVQLARGRRPRGAVIALVGLLLVASVALNLGDLRSGARSIRSYSDFVAPDLGALELARDTVDPAFVPEPNRAPDIVAGEYFAAVDRHPKSPADTEAEILDRPEFPRQSADVVLQHALRLAVEPVSDTSNPSAPPAPVRADGTVVPKAGCLDFKPRAGGGQIELRLPPAGLRVEASTGPPVLISLRRFGSTYVKAGEAPGESLFLTRQAFGHGLLRAPDLRVPAAGAGALRIPEDRSSRPWHALVTTVVPIRLCGP